MSEASLMAWRPSSLYYDLQKGYYVPGTGLDTEGIGMTKPASVSQRSQYLPQKVLLGQQRKWVQASWGLDDMVMGLR